MKTILPALLAGLIALPLSPTLLAQQQARIQLQDGSSLHGEIIGLDSGVYRIRTRHLGVIELNEADISSLSIGSPPVGADTSAIREGNAMTAQIDDLQKGLMSDEVTMNLIMELSDDPAIQAILNNPALMQSITSGDIGAISNSPEFTRLLNHPKIQAIQQQSGILPSR